MSVKLKPLSLMLCAYFNVCNCMYMYIMSSKVLLEKKTPHMIALFDSHVNENINYVSCRQRVLI